MARVAPLQDGEFRGCCSTAGPTGGGQAASRLVKVGTLRDRDFRECCWNARPNGTKQAAPHIGESDGLAGSRLPGRRQEHQTGWQRARCLQIGEVARLAPGGLPTNWPSPADCQARTQIQAERLAHFPGNHSYARISTTCDFKIRSLRLASFSGNLPNAQISTTSITKIRSLQLAPGSSKQPHARISMTCDT